MIASTLDRVLKHLLQIEAFELNFQTPGPFSTGWSLLQSGLRFHILAFCSTAAVKTMTFINISDLPPQMIYSCSRLEHLKLENTYRPLPPRRFSFDPKGFPTILSLEIADESLNLITSSSAQYPELLETFSGVRELETDYAPRLPPSTHQVIMAMAASLHRLRLTSTLNYTYNPSHMMQPQIDLGSFTCLSALECRYWLMSPTRIEFAVIWNLFKQVRKPTAIQKIDIQLHLHVGSSTIEDGMEKTTAHRIWPHIDTLFFGPLFPSLKTLRLHFHISCNSQSNTSIERVGDKHKIEVEVVESYRQKLPETQRVGILDIACTVRLENDADQ